VKTQYSYSHKPDIPIEMLFCL